MEKACPWLTFTELSSISQWGPEDEFGWVFVLQVPWNKLGSGCLEAAFKQPLLGGHPAARVQAASPCTLVRVPGEDTHRLVRRTCPVPVLRAHPTLSE